MSDDDGLIRGIKATFVSRFVSIAANGLLILLLSRFLLGPEGYGMLFLALSILAVAQLVADLGIARSAARYVSQYKETDRGQVPHILHISLRIKVVLIAVVVVALVAGRHRVASVLGQPELAVLLLVGCGYVVAFSCKNYTVSVFQGFNAVEYSAVVTIVDYTSRVVFVVVFVTLGWGVLGALVGYIAGGMLASGLGFGLLFYHFYRQYDPATRPAEGLRRRILEYSVPLTASESANVLDRRIDIVLIGFFLTPAAVGFYTLAKQIAEFVVAPAGSVGFALSPAYGEEKANDRLERAARIYESSLQFVVLLYVPAAVGLLLVAEPAVTLVFGTDYAGAVPVVQVLCLYLFFQAVTNVTTQALDYLGRARHRAIAKGITSVLNVVLTILFIPVWGIVGAAVATVLTFGLYTLANVYVMHVELPLSYGRLGRIASGAIGISAVMGATVLVVADEISGLLSLGAVVALGIVIWAGLATASGLLDVRKAVSMLT